MSLSSSSSPGGDTDLEDQQVQQSNTIAGSPIMTFTEPSEVAAPPTRRRGLAKLRRRLSQTFRLSFHGSLSELASQQFTIEEVSHDTEVAAAAEHRRASVVDGDPRGGHYRKEPPTRKGKFMLFNPISNTFQLRNLRQSYHAIRIY